MEHRRRSPSRIAPFVIATLLAVPAVLGQSDGERSFDRGSEAFSRGDCDEALRLWREAAHAGNLEAQTLLGTIHYTGECGRRDLRQAFDWLKTAAERGSAVSYTHLRAHET